jgi:hypothetical protein
MADEVDLDEALDALYATPPEDFTAARNDLAKALTAAGRKDEAAEVAPLRKPNRLVWALDQLALDEDATLAPLLEAAMVVREGRGDDLKAAVAGLREAVNAAAAAAAARLEARPADRADLAAALLAVVADEPATDELARGRLLEVPAPDAFGLGPAVPAPRKTSAKPRPRPKAVDPTGRPPDQLAVRRATKRQKEAAKEADAAQRALARAEKALETATEALRAADDGRDRAVTAVSHAAAALAQAKADLERAEGAGAKAAEAQDRAGETLAEEQERTSAALAELGEATVALAVLDPP